METDLDTITIITDALAASGMPAENMDPEFLTGIIAGFDVALQMFAKYDVSMLVFARDYVSLLKSPVHQLSSGILEDIQQSLVSGMAEVKAKQQP